MKVVTKHISLTVTRICTILVMLGCVQTYANSSRFSELEKDAVNNSENPEFGTGKEKTGRVSILFLKRLYAHVGGGQFFWFSLYGTSRVI